MSVESARRDFEICAKELNLLVVRLTAISKTSPNEPQGEEAHRPRDAATSHHYAAEQRVAMKRKKSHVGAWLFPDLEACTSSVISVWRAS